MFELIFALSNFRLPNSLRAELCSNKVKISPTSQSLWRMLECTDEIIVLSNDIASYKKEKQKQDIVVYDNLLLYRERYCYETAVQAYSYVLQKINYTIREFFELELQLSFKEYEKNPSEIIACHNCVILMKDMMRGNIDWSIETQRYNSRAKSLPIPKL